jgi:hypothetical protein
MSAQASVPDATGSPVTAAINGKCKDVAAGLPPTLS